MASFKKSLEDNIEMTGDVATNSSSVVIINCRGKGTTVRWGSLCKV